MAATWIDRAPSPAPLAQPPRLPQSLGYRL